MVPNKDITHFVDRFSFFGPFMGMGVARTAFDKFSQLGTFFGVSWVHYQPIPGAKPFEFKFKVYLLD